MSKFQPIELKRADGVDRMSVDLEVKFVDDGTAPGTFSGYGAVFGNRDSYDDVITKGAFKETIRDWKSRKRFPPMLLQHALGMTTDDELPVGVWTLLEEDDVGLKVEGRLIALDTDRGKYIYEGMKVGALDGLSIGYRVKESAFGTKPTEPRRTIKKAELIEVSIVTFPANDLARISQAKSAMPTEREIERTLREAGLSASEAKTLIASGYKSLKGARDAAESEDGAVQALKRLENLLRA